LRPERWEAKNHLELIFRYLSSEKYNTNLFVCKSKKNTAKAILLWNNMFYFSPWPDSID
jgi:hypothetical protein